MSGAITAAVGGAIVGGIIANKGSKSAAAAAATKDSATSTAGTEVQSGTNDVAATLKSLGYTDEQINELTSSIQQQQSQEATSQNAQTQTSNTSNQTGSTAQNQTSTGTQQQSENQATTGTQTTAGTQATTDNQVSASNQSAVGSQTTAQQLTDNLSQAVQGSQTQGSVLNKFQAGNVDPAQQLFNATAAGISPEQYQAIVAKAGLDLEGQVSGLTRSLATASGTSNANNSGLALGLEKAKQDAAITAAAQSVAASQANQQIANSAAGTIAGATTGNNQTLEQWLQQQTSTSQQQQVQATTGTQATTNNVANTGTQANTSNTATTGVQQNASNTATTGTQATANNTATTGTSAQTTQDLANQLAIQTGTKTGANTTTGQQSVDRTGQTATSQDTNQQQFTVSTGRSQYGESSATDVDSLRVPGVTAPVVNAAPATGNFVGMSEPNPRIPRNNDYQGYAEGGLISGMGSALPGSAPSRGTAHANGTPGNVAAAQVLMQEASRKAATVTNAASVLSKYFATPLTDKDGKQIKNSDGTPIYPAQNITDALKSATGVGDFFSRLGKNSIKSALTNGISQSISSANLGGAPGQSTMIGGMGSDFGDFSLDGYAEGGQIGRPGDGNQANADLAAHIASAAKSGEMQREQAALADREMQAYRKAPYYHGYEDYSPSGRMALEAYNSYMAQNKLRPDTQVKGIPPYNAAAARYAQQVQQKAQRSLLLGGEPLSPSVDGYSNGGLINGPGTGTSDSIPAVVDGKRPIAVSDGEYVIPEHVVEAVGVDYFDSLLAHFKNAKI